MFQSQKDVERILSALGEQIEQTSEDTFELLVCGGSALTILGLVERTTGDVDVLAYVRRGNGGRILIIKADPLRPELSAAAAKVARDFDLPDKWLNAGPAPAVDLGLPDGIMERVVTRRFGQKLTIHFLGRFDQIHFKLYAAVDQGPGKHLDDLQALKPTSDEIEQAARWTMTHDVSDSFRQSLKDLLNHLGFKDVAERI
jgi:hypothetical protein